jgi:hypothetical protein
MLNRRRSARRTPAGCDEVTLDGIGIAAGVVLLVAITLLPVAVLVILANRHLAGRKSRLDDAFGGIGRAAQLNSHLQAGTPPPDELGLHLPPRPDPAPAPRHRSRDRRQSHAKRP